MCIVRVCVANALSQKASGKKKQKRNKSVRVGNRPKKSGGVRKKIQVRVPKYSTTVEKREGGLAWIVMIKDQNQPRALDLVLHRNLGHF